MSGLRRHLTYANVMATVAVFIALGGAAYAGSKIGGNQIARNAIGSKHVKPNSLRGVDIREQTLTVARAWAEITPGGGVRKAHGIGAAQVTHPTNVIPVGIYCIVYPARNASATPGAVPGEGVAELSLYSREAMLDQGGSPTVFGCPSGSNWVVQTHQDATAKNAYFHIIFH